MSELENKKQIVKDLLEKGKKKGVLTHNEIIQSFYETESPKSSSWVLTVWDFFDALRITAQRGGYTIFGQQTQMLAAL